jgi:hypothetical protein
MEGGGDSVCVADTTSLRGGWVTARVDPRAFNLRSVWQFYSPYIFQLCAVKTALAKTALGEGLLQGCTRRGSQVTRATELYTVAASIHCP